MLLSSELDLVEVGLIKFSVTSFQLYGFREFRQVLVNQYLVYSSKKPKCGLGFSVQQQIELFI